MTDDRSKGVHENPGLQKPEDDRLESWKRISNYLNRDIRTLRRWEKKEGMPIHRQMHETLPTVYAYKSELDAWQASRSKTTRKTPVATQRKVKKKSAWLVLTTVATAAIIIALILNFNRDTKDLPFDARDWILITQFENRTGDSLFDGTLKYALQRELSNSVYVNVVSQERISDTRALMKLAADTVIDQDIGREISMRDGDIKALLTGRIEKLGDSYMLGAELLNPQSGITIAGFSEVATSDDDLPDAINRLATEVRLTLGESLAEIATESDSLEKVTTPSLKALQLYSQANTLMMEHKKGQAYELLQQALTVDPDFASGQTLMGYLLLDRGEPEQAKIHFSSAMDLVETTSDRERFFILASYYTYVEDDLPKTINALELLVRKYPDHYWANSRLQFIQKQLGQPLRALPYGERRADLRPNDFNHQMSIIQDLLIAGNHQRLQPFLDRAKKLAKSTWEKSGFYSIDAQQKWLGGDISAANAAADRLYRESTIDPGDLDFSLAFPAVSMYLALGRIKDAQDIIAQWAPQSEISALLNIWLDNESGLDSALEDAVPSHRTAILLARGGRIQQAEIILSDPAINGRVYAPFLLRYWESLAYGELTTAQGEAETAIGHYQEFSTMPPAWPTAYFFLGFSGLATALTQEEDDEAAIQMLEQASKEQAGSIFWLGATMFWMQNQALLIELHGRKGEYDKAEKIKAELNDLLAVADANHPILLKINNKTVPASPNLP